MPQHIRFVRSNAVAKGTIFIVWTVVKVMLVPAMMIVGKAVVRMENVELRIRPVTKEKQKTKSLSLYFVLLVYLP